MNELYSSDNEYTSSYQPQQRQSNWPEFLVNSTNQILFSIIAFFTTGFIVGIVMAVYYLFILDKSYEKSKAATIISWATIISVIIVPILFFIIFFAIAGLSVASL